MIIEILDSWILTGRGIIVELKHNCAGLRQGTRLTSRQTGQQWTINSRLIFNHTADRQKRFPDETETLTHLTFKSIGNLEKSKADILDKERQGIYQYHLDPSEQNEKPIIGDKLEI